MAVTVKRLNYLRRMLTKYSAAYYRNVERGLSSRMYSWTDEYDAASGEAPEVWRVYCAEHGSSLEHTSFDLFA